MHVLSINCNKGNVVHLCNKYEYSTAIEEKCVTSFSSLSLYSPLRGIFKFLNILFMRRAASLIGIPWTVRSFIILCIKVLSITNVNFLIQVVGGSIQCFGVCGTIGQVCVSHFPQLWCLSPSTLPGPPPLLHCPSPGKTRGLPPLISFLFSQINCTRAFIFL